MVVHQLLSYLLPHPGEGEVGPGQVPAQVGEGLLHEVLHAKPLVLGDAGRQAEPVDAAANPDPGGVHRGGGVDGSLDLAGVHVAGVLAVGRDTVVLLDERVEHISKHLRVVQCWGRSERKQSLTHLVGVPVPGVDTAVLVVKLHGAGNGLAESEACNTHEQ